MHENVKYGWISRYADHTNHRQWGCWEVACQKHEHQLT
jgi:hypothetical protein